MLTRVALVVYPCSLFHDATRYEKTCDHVKLRPITDHSIKGLPRRCPKLKVLSLAYLRRVTHDALETVVEDLPLLQRLDVRGIAGKPLSLDGIRELIDAGSV